MTPAPPASDVGQGARRAVFLDIDGTLAHHGVVPAAHAAVVRAGRAAGHRVFLCTGRPRSMVPQRILDIGFDGLVGAAGAYVLVDGAVVVDTRFPAELATRLRAVLDREQVAYVLEAPEAVYGPPGVERRLAGLLTRHRGGTTGHEGPRDLLDALRTDDDLAGVSFGKVTCFESRVPVASIAAEVGASVSALPSSIPDLGAGAGELYLTGVHKAVGMQAVAEHLGFGREEVIAVGDGLNDLEMLAFAGCAVAIEGSDPRLLDIAHRVAAGPEREGLVALFAELGLV